MVCHWPSVTEKKKSTPVADIFFKKAKVWRKLVATYRMRRDGDQGGKSTTCRSRDELRDWMVARSQQNDIETGLDENKGEDSRRAGTRLLTDQEKKRPTLTMSMVSVM